MDHLGLKATEQNTVLVIFAFLQADRGSTDYSKELLSLGKDLNLTRDVNWNGPEIHSLDNGDLETDGHLPSNIRGYIHDIQPLVEPHFPGNHEQAAAVHEVARVLEEIAAQFEERVVAQATRNLSNNISNTPSNQWQHHLGSEVERVIMQGVGLEHLPQERVMAALALTLVKGVCMQAPRLLRNLFQSALQYIDRVRAL